jgi:hypothetical protein
MTPQSTINAMAAGIVAMLERQRLNAELEEQKRFQRRLRRAQKKMTAA